MAKMETGARAQMAADSQRRQGFFKVLWRRRAEACLLFGAIFLLSVVALFVLPTRYLAVGSVIVAEQEQTVESASSAWAEKIGDPADLESQLLVIWHSRCASCGWRWACRGRSMPCSANASVAA